MRKLSCLAGIAACFFLSLGNIAAAESNRMLVSVSKKTISRPADKSSSGSDRTRRQTLAVSVTNQSVQTLPAGVIRWTAVVRKPYSELLKHTGKSDLPVLPSFKMAEVQCGAFNVKMRQSESGTETDRVEYEIAIFHDGKETYRTSSVSNFAILASKAESADTDDNPEEMDAKNDDDPEPKLRKPAELATVGAEKKTPEKASMPVVEIARPVTEPPPVPQKPFDFFNLRGKSSPPAK